MVSEPSYLAPHTFYRLQEYSSRVWLPCSPPSTQPNARVQVHRALRILGVTHLAAGLRTMEEPDEEGDLENTEMENSSKSLSQSLEYFESLIASAKETKEALTMAQAYRFVKNLAHLTVQCHDV